MELKNNLSLQEMKEIFYGIMEEENRKYQLETKGIPVMMGTIFKTNKYKEKLKLTHPDIKPIKGLITYRGAFYPQNNNIFIVLNHFNSISNTNPLASLIKTSYHEARHAYQHKMISDSSYESFMMQVEWAIMKNPIGYLDYKINHNNYMIEIDANNYGISKAIEYLKKYPNLYDQNEEYLKKLQEKTQYEKLMYNSATKIEMLDKCIKANPNPKKRINQFKQLNVFYNEDGSFKRVSEIMKAPIDNKIIEAVLSSISFLNQLNLDELTVSEGIYLIKILTSVKETRLMQREIYQKNIKKIKEDLISSSNLTEYLRSLEQLTKILLQQTLYYINRPRINSNLLYNAQDEKFNKKSK